MRVEGGSKLVVDMGAWDFVTKMCAYQGEAINSIPQVKKGKKKGRNIYP